MRKWLKQNWFKLGVLVVWVIIGCSVACYFTVALLQRNREARDKMMASKTDMAQQVAPHFNNLNTSYVSSKIAPIDWGKIEKQVLGKQASHTATYSVSPQQPQDSNSPKTSSSVPPTSSEIDWEQIEKQALEKQASRTAAYPINPQQPEDPKSSKASSPVPPTSSKIDGDKVERQAPGQTVPQDFPSLTPQRRQQYSADQQTPKESGWKKAGNVLGNFIKKAGTGLQAYAKAVVPQKTDPAIPVAPVVHLSAKAYQPSQLMGPSSTDVGDTRQTNDR